MTSPTAKNSTRTMSSIVRTVPARSWCAYVTLHSTAETVCGRDLSALLFKTLRRRECSGGDGKARRSLTDEAERDEEQHRGVVARPRILRLYAPQAPHQPLFSTLNPQKATNACGSRHSGTCRQHGEVSSVSLAGGAGTGTHTRRGARQR